MKILRTLLGLSIALLVGACDDPQSIPPRPIEGGDTGGPVSPGEFTDIARLTCTEPLTAELGPGARARYRLELEASSYVALEVAFSYLVNVDLELVDHDQQEVARSHGATDIELFHRRLDVERSPYFVIVHAGPNEAASYTLRCEVFPEGR
jgi:hypothetical protein